MDTPLSALDHYSPGPGIDLFLGDCKMVLEDLASDKVEVDLALFDPPYGIAYKGTGAHKLIANDSKPHVEFLPPIAALLKDNSAMFVCSREDVAEEWRAEMRDHLGLHMKTSVIWDKRHWTMGDSLSDFRRQTEMILVAHKGRALLHPWTWSDLGQAWAPYVQDWDPKKVVKRDTCMWSFPVPRDRQSQRHPTPKPPEIMERAMLSHTAPGELVLDPFMGGAPVGVACIRQGRRYVGIELEPEYFAIAKENVDRAWSQERPL